MDYHVSFSGVAVAIWIRPGDTIITVTFETHPGVTGFE